LYTFFRCTQKKQTFYICYKTAVQDAICGVRLITWDGNRASGCEFLAGTDIQIKKTTDLQGCQMDCKAQSECSHFNFDKVCILKISVSTKKNRKND
jgi:hypothetical protein